MERIGGCQTSLYHHKVAILRWVLAENRQGVLTEHLDSLLRRAELFPVVRLGILRPGPGSSTVSSVLSHDAIERGCSLPQSRQEVPTRRRTRLQMLIQPGARASTRVATRRFQVEG